METRGPDIPAPCVQLGSHAAAPCGGGSRRHRALAVLLGVIAAAGMLGLLAPDPLRPLRAARRTSLAVQGAVYEGRAGVVLQRTLFDCGPAALANLLEIRGAPVPPLDSLARLAGTTATGTTLGGLARAATQLGLPVRLVRRDPARFTGTDGLPMVAWVDRSHFVVVSDTSSGMLTIVDPQIGRYRTSRGAFRRRWSGEALVSVSLRPSVSEAGILTPTE